MTDRPTRCSLLRTHGLNTYLDDESTVAPSAINKGLHVPIYDSLRFSAAIAPFRSMPEAGSEQEFCGFGVSAVPGRSGGSQRFGSP